MQIREIDRLLVRVAAEDNDALEELYLKTKNGIFAFLYTYLGQFEATEDALQTVFLKIKLHASQYTPGTNGRAWILQIAKNTALTELNRNSRTTPLTELDENDPALIVTPDFDCRSVSATMKRVLTEEEQQIVTLHVLWGYRHREIGQLYGLPIGTVTSKYKRALAKLKKALQEEEA